MAVLDRFSCSHYEMDKDLGNLYAFLSSADFSYQFFRNTIRVSNSLDPDQAQLFAKVISRQH